MEFYLAYTCLDFVSVRILASTSMIYACPHLMATGSFFFELGRRCSRPHFDPHQTQGCFDWRNNIPSGTSTFLNTMSYELLSHQDCAIEAEAETQRTDRDRSFEFWVPTNDTVWNVTQIGISPNQKPVKRPNPQGRENQSWSWSDLDSWTSSIDEFSITTLTPTSGSTGLPKVDWEMIVCQHRGSHPIVCQFFPWYLEIRCSEPQTATQFCNSDTQV